MIIFGPSLNVVYVMYVYTESIADLQKGLQIVMGPVHDVSCCYWQSVMMVYYLTVVNSVFDDAAVIQQTTFVANDADDNGIVTGATLHLSVLWQTFISESCFVKWFRTKLLMMWCNLSISFVLWQVMANQRDSVIVSFTSVWKLMLQDHSAFIHLKARLYTAAAFVYNFHCVL